MTFFKSIFCIAADAHVIEFIVLCPKTGIDVPQALAIR